MKESARFSDEYRKCFLCERSETSNNRLDKHHLFGGANRAKSEKYGLTVLLCHNRCHIFGKYSVHQNGEVMQYLHKYGQRKAMQEQNWTVEQFIKEFGRNYL